MQHRIPYLVLLSVALLFFLVSTGYSQENDEEPTYVELLYFMATAQEEGIRLDWETATEQNTAGFEIKRGLAGSDNYFYLDNIGFIIAMGDVATGATYSATDNSAIYGETYTYILVEVEFDSDKIDMASATVTYNLLPTATPIIAGGTNPDITQTPTPIPTSTPIPTATTANINPTRTVEPPKVDTPDPIPSELLTPIGQSPEPAQIITRDDILSAPSNNDSAPSNIAFAQEQNPTAYPGPEIVTPLSEESAYPDNQQPQSNGPPQPDRAFTASEDTNGEIVPTIAVIGSDVGEYPLSAIAQAAAPSSDAIRGRLFLWLGFIIALFIFLTGVAGSIILYRRR